MLVPLRPMPPEVPLMTALRASALVATFALAAACGDDNSTSSTPDATDAAADGTTTDAGGTDVIVDVDPPDDDATLWGQPHNDDWQVAFDATPYGAFMSVWGPTPTEVYTVGGQPMLMDGSGDGVMFRFDGASWDEVNVPDGPMLNWVHGVDGIVWTVGEAGRAIRLVDGEVDGEFATGVDVPLWGVWAAAPDDVWAVGGDARDRNGDPVIVHFDGEAWTVEEIPALDRDTVALFKVWGTGPDNVFAVGARGVILRYDGTAWAQVASGTGEDLVSLWGRSETDIVAVGGRSIGVMGRWDGTAWSFEELGRVSGLNGSWMDYTGVVYVDGVGGRILKFPPGSNEFEDISSPTSNVLHAIFGFDEGPAFAVGGTLAASPPYEGDVIQSIGAAE